MTKADKQLERLRQNPKNVSFAELCIVVERHGFVVRTVRGSHYQFRHESLPEVLTIPARSPVKPVYVRIVLQLIDRLRGEE